MSIIKGPGGQKGIHSDPGNSSSRASTKPFKEILTAKQSGPKVDSTIRSDPATIKGRLADLLKQGAHTREVVATALQKNPLFNALPPASREDMLKQVTAQMEPLLNSKS